MSALASLQTVSSQHSLNQQMLSCMAVLPLIFTWVKKLGSCCTPSKEVTRGMLFPQDCEKYFAIDAMSWS